MSKLHVIGISNDGITGLTSHSQQLLRSVDVILGEEDVLRLVPELKAERIVLGTTPAEMVESVSQLLESEKTGVILAVGDPLFYGVARYLCDRLGKDRFEVHPHVSSMQLAFARIKESWEEAYLVSLATHRFEEVVDRIRVAETVGLFTTEEESPPRIARHLQANGIDYFTAFVCENLGAPDERVTQGDLQEIEQLDFAPLNVMILKRLPDRPDRRSQSGKFLRFGNPDEIFEQSRPKSGLLTQSEVRSLALAQMELYPGDVVWDVGAGSGAVALEAARLTEPGMVYAIEKDVVDHQLIQTNAETFGVRNLRAILGTAPAVFPDLPAPDSIFIGGTGREMTLLLEEAFGRLRTGGRLVTHVATLETLTTSYAALKQLARSVQVLLVSLARSTEQMETLRFDALNPTYLLKVKKLS